MNKKVLFISAGLVAVIIFCFVYLAFVKNDMPPMSAPATTTEETLVQTPPQQPTPEQPATSPGTYQIYTADAVAGEKNTKILFFHAPWCPQCRELEASIQAGTIPDNVTIFKVDYDSNQVLRQKYGVTLQTTLVKIDDSGNMVKKFVAYSEPSLAAIVRNLLP